MIITLSRLFTCCVPLANIVLERTGASNDQATAEHEYGVLTITLPKLEGGRTKTIKVRPK